MLFPLCHPLCPSFSPAPHLPLLYFFLNQYKDIKEEATLLDMQAFSLMPSPLTPDTPLPSTPITPFTA